VPRKIFHQLFFAGLWLLILASPALDQPLTQTARSWGQDGPGWYWGLAAYWAGLGGLQMAALALWALAAWFLRQWVWLACALGGFAAVVVSGILSQVIKHLMGRPRPRLGLSPLELIGPTLNSDFTSFPSGHAATSFALAAVLAYFYPRGAWLIFLAAAWVGVGRIASGSHFLSDVLGGAVLGLMTGLPLAYGAMRRQGLLQKKLRRYDSA
jgi:undecaprenyl-diphosphatase